VEVAVEIAQIEAVLAVADELHFGRAAERLHVSQPMVSRRISDLEREIGGRLFERTSRRVQLTPLGRSFVESLTPGYAQITAALRRARTSAVEPGGSVTVGFTTTTEGPGITSLVEAHRAAHPASTVKLRQVPTMDPYTALRAGQIDVLINWLAGGEPDLTFGPEIDRQDRLLAVSSGHPLARRQHVHLEDLAGLPVCDTPETFPASIMDLVVPPRTPSGTPIPRTHLVRDVAEMWSLVALGHIVHPTVATVAAAGRTVREDITFMPILDMPPAPLGLIWCTAHENARIRAFAHTARTSANGRTAGGRDRQSSVAGSSRAIAASRSSARPRS
jgi:DNA-binding transcriptional LysR family regulator